MLKACQEATVAKKARALGRDLSDKELGIVVTQMRKYLSTFLIRAKNLCLLNRLCFLGRELWQQLERGAWPTGGGG
jgi:hypothetical protein